MTHNARVLALLSDGRPHTHHELYALFVIAHSRVSDLRKKGYVINTWRDGDDYMYQLEQNSAVGPSSVHPFPEKVEPAGCNGSFESQPSTAEHIPGQTDIFEMLERAREI